MANRRFSKQGRTVSANRRKGDETEKAVCNRLRALGMQCVQKIGTPWRIIRGASGGIVDAKPGARVSGDFHALVDGRGVLIESKRRDERLRWSDLKDHQHMALKQWREAGGLALIAWHNPGRGIAVFEYRIDQALFRKGKALQWADAEELPLCSNPLHINPRCI